MKTVLTLICLFGVSTLSYSQADPCKGITKEVKELQGIIRYSTPVMMGPAIDVIKTFTRGQQVYAAIFSFYRARPNYTSRGLYIQLSDGTVIKDENAKIDCTFSSGDSYRYTGVIALNDDDADKLATTSIIKYALGEEEQKVPEKGGNKVKGWIACMNTKTE